MALLAALVLAVTPGIRTPSGNISCFVARDVLHCAIRNADYRIRCADLDWHGWELTARSPVRITCSGGILSDTPPRYRTLPYGRTWRHGPFTCRSQRVGLACRNAGGHELFVSRQRWSRR